MDVAPKFEGNMGGVGPTLVPPEIVTKTLESLDTDKKVPNPFTRMAQGVVNVVRQIRTDTGKRQVLKDQLQKYMKEHPNALENYWDPDDYLKSWIGSMGKEFASKNLVVDLLNISNRLVNEMYDFLDQKSHSMLGGDLLQAQIDAELASKYDIGAKMEVVALLLPHTLPYKGNPPEEVDLKSFFSS